LERSDLRRLTRRNEMKAVTQSEMPYYFRSKTTTWQAIMNTYYYVYILQSENNPEKHYTGFTNNLEERLKKHNEGGCPHTSKNKPWILNNFFAFRSQEKAIAFEKYLKSGSGREFSRRHF